MSAPPALGSLRLCITNRQQPLQPPTYTLLSISAHSSWIDRPPTPYERVSGPSHRWPRYIISLASTTADNPSAIPTVTLNDSWRFVKGWFYDSDDPTV